MSGINNPWLRQGVATALLALGAAGTASATSVGSQLFFGETNLLSDNSMNWLINSNGTLSDSDSILDVGDKIRATFQIETVEDLTGGGGTNNFGTGGVNEFTFLEQVIITAITGGAGGGGVGCSALSTCNVFFGPDPAFQAEVEALLGAAAGTFLGVTAIGFEDDTPNYQRTDAGAGTQAARLAALEATATDGTPVISVGFGDLDDLIVITGLSSLDVSVIAATPAPGAAGNAVFQQSLGIGGLNLLTAGFAQVPATVASDDGLVDLNATVSVLGIGGATTPADWFDDFNGVIRPLSVPEPSSIALMGLGLVGLGGALRRRRGASA